MPLRPASPTTSTPQKSRVGRHSLPATLTHDNVSGGAEEQQRNRGARVRFSRDDPPASRPSNANIPPVHSTDVSVLELVHQLQKKVTERDNLLEVVQASDLGAGDSLIQRLQDQVLARDQRITELEALEIDLRKTLGEREEQHRKDLAGRDIWGLKELEERDKQYQRGIEERDELHQKDLEDREQQYQQDLDEIRTLIDHAKHQMHQPVGENDLDATRRAGDLPPDHFDGLVASADAGLAASTWDTLSQEGEKVHDLSDGACTTSMILELQKAAAEREAYIVDIEANFEELQRMAETQASRMAELEVSCKCGVAAEGTNNPGQDAGAVSEMELRLGKLLEAASARITQLEGQQGPTKTDAAVTVDGLEKQLRQLKEVALTQATRIVKLEGQQSLDDAAAEDSDMQIIGSVATTLAEFESWNIEMSIPTVYSAVLPDSETSTVAGSSEIPSSHSAPSASVSAFTSSPPKLAPFPRVATVPPFSQPSGGYLIPLSPRERQAAARREISPGKLPTSVQVPMRKDRSPVRYGGSVMCSPGLEQLQGASRREGSPVRQNAAVLRMPKVEGLNHRRELSPTLPARPVRDLSPVHAGNTVVCTPRSHLRHDGTIGGVCVPSLLQQGASAIQSASVLGCAATSATGLAMSMMMAATGAVPAVEAVAKGKPFVYNGGYNTRSYSPIRNQGSHVPPPVCQAPRPSALSVQAKAMVDSSPVKISSGTCLMGSAGSSLKVPPGILSSRESTAKAVVDAKELDKQAAQRILHL